MDIVNKKGRSEVVDPRGSVDDQTNDVVHSHSDSSQGESSHDSDYDFANDDDNDIIFNNCVVAPKQELGA